MSPGVNLCNSPPELLVHQYLNRLDAIDWRGNLLSLQAYLMTQVRRTSPHQQGVICLVYPCSITGAQAALFAA